MPDDQSDADTAAPDTLQLDVVLYQPEFGEVTADLAYLPYEDGTRIASDFFDESVETDTLLDTALSMSDANLEDDVPLSDVPPPRDADDEPLGVYKVGEVTFNPDGSVTGARFDEGVREHTHLDKFGEVDANTSDVHGPNEVVENGQAEGPDEPA